VLNLCKTLSRHFKKSKPSIKSLKLFKTYNTHCSSPVKKCLKSIHLKSLSKISNSKTPQKTQIKPLVLASSEGVSGAKQTERSVVRNERSECRQGTNAAQRVADERSHEYLEICFVRCFASHLHSLHSLRSLRGARRLATPTFALARPAGSLHSKA